MKPDLSLIPERQPVFLHPRKTLRDEARADLFLAHKGVCGICREKIFGRWEVEHRLPLSQGGSNDPDNLYPAHPTCHAEKTAKDAADTAKAKRRAGETCAGETKRPIPRRPFGSLSRKFNGAVGPTAKARRQIK